MRTRYDQNAWDPSDSPLLQLILRNLPLVVFLVLAVAGMFGVYWYFTPTVDGTQVVSAETLNTANSAPIFKAIPAQPVAQRMIQSPGPLRIGILSGHRNNDAGAVCADGLTEADVNYDIASRVIATLNANGVRTDLLDEFDPRLDSYVATGLISIHADSCDYINDLATGFKVAGSSYTDSEALSICVEEAYAVGTQMSYHANTITPHMTDYHVFRKIAIGTPAIIIETGFMNLDREMLTTNAQVPADAIAQGIMCFINQSKATAVTASTSAESTP